MRFSLMGCTALLIVSGCSVPGIIILHDPLSAGQHVSLADIYEAGGEHELALREYSLAAHADAKEALPLMRLAEQAYAGGDLDKAVSLYEQVLDRDAHNGDALNNLAWVLLEAGDLDRAREHAERASALASPRRPWYLDTLGMVLLLQGAAEEAVAVLTEAVASMPAEPQDRVAQAERHLGAARAALK